MNEHDSILALIPGYPELRTPERQRVDAHAQTCQVCATALERQQWLRSQLAHGPRLVPDPAAVEAVRAAIGQRALPQAARGKNARRSRWLVAAVPVGALVLVAVLVGLLFVRQDWLPDPHSTASTTSGRGQGSLPAARSAAVGEFVWQTDGVYGYEMLRPAGWEAKDLGNTRQYVAPGPANRLDWMTLEVVNYETSLGNGQPSGADNSWEYEAFKQNPTLQGWAAAVEQKLQSLAAHPELLRSLPDARIYGTRKDDIGALCLMAVKVEGDQPLDIRLWTSGAYTDMAWLENQGVLDDLVTMVESARATPVDPQNVAPALAELPTPAAIQAPNMPSATLAPAPAPTLAPSLNPTVAPMATPISALPAACADETPDTSLLVSPEAGYCLRYPANFQSGFRDASAQPVGTWGVTLFDQNDADRTVSLDIQTAPANGRTLDQVVAEELSHYPKEVAAQVTQTPAQLGGEPAIIVDGLPGILLNRQAFVIHGDRLHHFVLLPWHDRAFEDRQAEAQALWDHVARSLAFVPTSDATSPAQDGGRIVFEAKSAAGEDLFGMKADGTDLMQITRGPGLNQEAACSPDGTRIAFTAWRDNTHYSYVIDVDGSQVKQLAGGPGNVAEPAWSPDGRQIVFNSEADKAFYLINADGSGQVKLPITGANLFSPVWSPDGQRLAYVSHTGQAADLHVARLDGTDDVNLTAGKGFAYQPAWSPDGRQIAFYGILEGGNTYNIYVMNADGSNVRRLTTSQDDGNRRNSFRPAWSPNGKQIAFHRDEGDGYDIWIMNADGSEQRQLTHGLNASNPCWLPAR